MADTIKILAQSNPVLLILTDVYTVPSSTSTVVSSLVVANQAGTASSFRISVARAGAADIVQQYLYYDVAIAGNTTFTATIGISLAATDKIRVYSGNGNISFNFFGVEIT